MWADIRRKVSRSPASRRAAEIAVNSARTVRLLHRTAAGLGGVGGSGAAGASGVTDAGAAVAARAVQLAAGTIHASAIGAAADARREGRGLAGGRGGRVCPQAAGNEQQEERNGGKSRKFHGTISKKNLFSQKEENGATTESGSIPPDAEQCLPRIAGERNVNGAQGEKGESQERHFCRRQMPNCRTGRVGFWTSG